ncbi:MAG: hypothetical protein ACRC18_07170 [Cetobacterium sp.]
MKYSNLECKMSTFSEVENPNLMKVKILVQHDGQNKNGSKFSLEAMKKAESSLKNIPILAYIKQDEDGEVDFDEHNMITKLTQTDDGLKLTTYYLEKPIGLIPESSEIEYVEQDGRTYLQASGYIWRRYGNEAYDIINECEEKGTSMEIEVISGAKDEEDGFYDITDYQFLGVTCLGDDVEPGMFNTTIKKYSSSKNYKKCLEDIYKEIYSIGKEDVVMDNIENVVETVENTQVEETAEVVEEQIEETVEEVEVTEDATEVVEEVVETETFALCVDNIRTSINSVLKDRTIETENYWGEKYQTREFYLYTILPEDKVAIVEDNVNYYNYYGVPYDMNGDDVVLDFDAKVPYIQEWRAKKENEVVEVFNKEDELKDMVLNKFADKEQELETIKESLTKLEEFKSKVDLEELKVNVEEVSNKFNLETDITELKQKAINKEISLEQFEEKIGYLFALEVVENKKNFSTKQDEPAKVKVQNNGNESSKRPYGGILD